MWLHSHYSLSHILTSICFPSAFAYFSSINNVGILVPPSNLAIFDVLTPVISDNSCCVSFCLFLSSTNCHITSEESCCTADWIISTYTSNLFSLFSFSFWYSSLFSFIRSASYYPVLSNYIINDMKLQYLFITLSLP